MMIAVILEIGPGRWLLYSAVGAVACYVLIWAFLAIGYALLDLEPLPRGVLLVEASP